jgi:hypothetical protein
MTNFFSSRFSSSQSLQRLLAILGKKRVYTHILKGDLERAVSALPSIIKKEEPSCLEEFPRFPLKEMLANYVNQPILN